MIVMMMMRMGVNGTRGRWRREAARRKLTWEKNVSAFLEAFRQMLGHVGMVEVDESDEAAQESSGLQSISGYLGDKRERSIQDVHGGLLVQCRRPGFFLRRLLADEGLIFLFQTFGEDGRWSRRNM